jgi:cytochrome c553
MTETLGMIETRDAASDVAKPPRRQPPCIAIVGGGVAGGAAARALRRRDAESILIDRRNHHGFQPLLYLVATAVLAPSEVDAPRQLAAKQENLFVVMAEVTGVDLNSRSLDISRPIGGSGEIAFDYLVLATGMRPSYFGHDEFAKHAPGLKTLRDAEAIRAKILNAYEAAELTEDENERARQLSFGGSGRNGCGHTSRDSAARGSFPRVRRVSAESRAVPDPKGALLCGVRWNGFAILLVSLMLGQATVTQAQTTERAPDTMRARLLACAPCHGPQGEGTKNDYFPRLAGKPAGYLMNQLVAFRNGRRRYPPMNYLLEYLPDAYLQKMADHFAALRPPPATETVVNASAAVLSRGRSLVTEGDAAQGVPACSHCHGPSLTGMQPAIPGLVGLRASYISAQLGAFRYGTRTAAAPDCMQFVAASLSERDVTAVAAWLASLPIPADPTPAPKGTLPMPLACGSEPR